MNLELIKEAIKKVVHFKPQEFDLFAQQVKLVQLAKNETWEARGRVAHHMAFVNQGILREYRVKDEEEFIQQFYVEGDFMGNYLSYQSNTPSETATVAIEPCEILQLPFKTLESLYTQVPAIQQFSEHIGQFKLQQIHQRASALLTQTPKERYLQLLQNQPELLQRVPQYLIAQYLGITPISLSRIRKRIFLNNG
ncbi:MAG TPA: hypothetical protein DCS93_35000 [Microscillaceae bacterium]|nr:hypothetical protein [Microscillaceae bacterium]